jgi:hypothetical protein
VGFGLGTPKAGSGCVLRVFTAHSSALLTLDVNGSGWNALRSQGVHQDFVMLPAAAEDVLEVPDIDPAAASRGAWLLGQRQDSGAGRLRWERLREQALQSGQQLLDAGSTTGLRVRIGGPGPVVLRPLQHWRWGAWAGRVPKAVCGAPHSGQQ